MRDFRSGPPGAALRAYLYAYWTLLVSVCTWASLARHLTLGDLPGTSLALLGQDAVLLVVPVGLVGLSVFALESRQEWARAAAFVSGCLPVTLWLGVFLACVIAPFVVFEAHEIDRVGAVGRALVDLVRPGVLVLPLAGLLGSSLVAIPPADGGSA